MGSQFFMLSDNVTTETLFPYEARGGNQKHGYGIYEHLYKINN